MIRQAKEYVPEHRRNHQHGVGSSEGTAVLGNQPPMLITNSITHKFRSWLDHKLKNDVYEIREGTIIRGRGRRPNHRVPVAGIVSWQVYPEMGVHIVTIELADGRGLVWFDYYNDLISILRKVAGDKELD